MLSLPACAQFQGNRHTVDYEYSTNKSGKTKDTQNYIQVWRRGPVGHQGYITRHGHLDELLVRLQVFTRTECEFECSVADLWQSRSYSTQKVKWFRL